jgi:3-oxoadipate enol-lactonase
MQPQGISSTGVSPELSDTEVEPFALERPVADVRDHAIAGDGTRIYFETFLPPGVSPNRPSSDLRAALLIMGLGANGRLWAPAVRRLLGAGYYVITVDNRGCGWSSTPMRPFTTQTMAADAVAVLDELEVERAHVGGASLGGMIAQELALEFPERVRSLILQSTTGGFRSLHLSPRIGLQRLTGALLRPLAGASDPEHQVSDFISTVASPEFAAQCRPGDESWEATAAMLECSGNQRGLALQLLAGVRHSTWSRLPRLQIPVLIHHGSRDSLVPLAAGRALAERIPRARFEVHVGAGHGIFEYLEEVGQMNLSFLASCDARASASSDQATPRPWRTRSTYGRQPSTT